MRFSSSRTLILPFLFVVFFLILIGFLFIYSSSFLFALEKHNSTYFYLKNQFVGFCMGLILFGIIQCVPVNLIRSYSLLWFIGSFFLTALTIMGYAHTIHGATRWLSLGGFSFQPSELLKIGFILYVANLLARNERQRASTIAPFICMAATAALLLLQPDFGLAVALTITLFALIFVAHPSLKYILFSLVLTLPAAMLLIITQPYRIRRILVFLNPWQDPQGAGFQIIQSLIAIGSGGWFGVGISHSKQKFFYLPMQHTDFIFSIIAEETGFVGTLMVICLYILFAYFGIRIARHIRNQFASYATFGFVFLITLQAIINIAVTIGLAPTKGIGLPFISYGKSALIGSLIIVGIIVRLARAYAHTEHLPKRFSSITLE